MQRWLATLAPVLADGIVENMKGRGRAKILLQWIAKVKAPTKIKRFAQRGVYNSRVGTSTHTAAGVGVLPADVLQRSSMRGLDVEPRWKHVLHGIIHGQVLCTYIYIYLFKKRYYALVIA